MKLRIVIILLVLPMLLSAQFERSNENKVLTLGFEYGYQVPGGDLKDRFGNSMGFGIQAEYLLKNNFSFGINYSFMFGSTVKEDPLAALRDQDSLFIGNNFSLAFIFLRQRSFYIGGSVGKLFPVLENNNRSGIKVNLGLGLFQHKIRIQDDPESFVPITAGDYKKGFDRLTNGIALQQFVGYQHMSKNRLVNFYAGLEFTQGFTQNRRSYNYDTMSADNMKRLDLISGFKVGWILPFFVGEKGEEVFY